jgi:hypothetical protein
MPVIPQYTASRNINANTAEPLRNEAAAPFQQDQKVLSTMQEVTQSWSDAQDVMQYTKFKADSEMAIAQLKAAAENDPNQENSSKYIKDLAKIKESSIKAFSNKAVEQKARAEIDKSIVLAGIEIDSEFKKKKLLTNELNLEVMAKGMAKKRTDAKTPALQMQIDQDYLDIIQANVGNGTITSARGKKLLDDYRLGYVDLDIMNDKATSKEQSYVYDQLKQGNKGAYPDLSDSERAERLEKTELHIRRNKYLMDFTANQNQNENEKNLILKIGTPEAEVAPIKDMLVSTSIRKSFGDKYTKAAYTPPAQETSPAAYNAIKLAQLKGKPPKEINDLIIDNVGQLTPEDKNRLVTASYNPYDKRTILIKASADALKEWGVKTFHSLMLGDVAADDIVYNFLQRAEADPQSNIDDVMKGVQKDYIRKAYPDTTLLQDVPNIIGNRNKIRRVYEKESKAAGKKAEVKPVSTVYQGMNVDFNDL